MEPSSIVLTANTPNMPQGIALRSVHADNVQRESNTPRKAPKACPIPAWGEAPGTGQPTSKSAKGAPYTSLGRSPRYKHATIRRLKARPISTSIPKIPLIEFNPIFLEKCTKLILKIHLAMMLRLSIDITNQCAQIRRPNRKRPIPSLPREPSQSRRPSLHPSRRGSLKLLNQLCDTRLAGQPNRKMNVVGNTTDSITLASGIADNCRHIGVKVRTYNVVDRLRAIFRAENQVNKQIGERLGHRDEYRSGFQPSLTIGPSTWGYAPCWYSDAPSALQQP